MMMSARVAPVVFCALTVGLSGCARGPAPSELEQQQGGVTNPDDEADDDQADDQADDDQGDDDEGDDDEADDQADDDTSSPPHQDAGSAKDASQLTVTPGKDAGVDAAVSADAGAALDAAVDAARDTGTAVVDAGPPCTPGTYAGSFEGELNGLLAFIRADVSGEITLQVTLASSGRALQIQSGSLDGVDQNGDPFVASVSGSIDCTTRQLLNGTILDGEYGRFLLRKSFRGVASANYSSNPALMGQLEFQNALGGSGGSATWSAYLK